MIQLGLRRAAQLCRDIPQHWSSAHVAGTNGKGSICAYLESAIYDSGFKCGKFTSPHLIDRWDSIQIDKQPVSELLFRRVDQDVRARNEKEQIGATEFEILTATAFEIFHHEKIDFGVVECGMGGGNDATNVLKNKTLAVISKIGLDHQEYLGNTLEDIAQEKCGIFRERVPIVFDDTNSHEVLKTIRHQAWRTGARPPRPDFAYDTLWPPEPDIALPILREELQGLPHQFANAKVAYFAAHHLLLARTQRRPETRLIVHAIASTTVPGRLQTIDLKSLTGLERNALLDGAHNPQAIETLLPLLERLRSTSNSICWVLASSDGKELRELFGPLLRPGDTVAAVEFGPVDGMPWKHPTASAHIKAFVNSLPDMHDSATDFGGDIKSALRWTAENSLTKDQSIVILGSLYLVSDILRMQRDADLA